MLFDLLLVSAAVLLNSRTAMAANGTPCQSVSSMSSAFISLYPSATIALVPAQAAEDCMKSVPLDKDEDMALIEEMTVYISWQSNLAYLVDPPAGYTEDRVDIVDEIKKIHTDLGNDKYKNEYDVMYDLSMALTKSYDFHFAFSPDILRNVFSFRRGNIGRGLLDEFALISVSSDGKALPKLYNYYDIMVAAKEGWTPSAISTINDKDAEQYVQNYSKTFVYHEDHARYNRLFPNQAQISMGDRVNQFGRSNFADGDYTTIKHENGSTFKYINNAIVPLDVFDNVEDGEAFFARFCNLGPPRTNSKRSVTIEKRAEPTATGFPKPETLHSEGVIGGYYLSGKGYDDVAVLSVPSFSPESEKGPAEFQDLIGTFLGDAVKAGKKRLVIDLRGNGGGRVFLGYDLFKQLFPSEDPYGATRFRANEAFDITGQFMTKYLENATYEEAVSDFQKNGLKSELGLAWQSIFNYKLPNTIDNKNFTSWEDFFGPHVFNNDNYTSVNRKDLNNFFSDDLTLDVTGYRTRANKLNKNQPFKSENIVLLQDGGCGSTCAVFSEFMKTQGGVQQVVVGGKPTTGPMQGVAGSKGAQVYTFTQVSDEASIAFNSLPAYQEELNKTELGALVYAERPLMRTAYQANGQSLSVINLRDNIRINDTSGIPLEFIYEAADCRLFYTADMIRDVTNTWKKTVDARWGDTKATCVEGSTGHNSSLSGGSPTSANNGNVKKGAGTRVEGVGAAMIATVAGLVGIVLMI
ncbi:uncharacterized protein BDR25DRAFT_342528 [Lindgomyces ingoldianus]|uniref:Uncharacterized protein n=1 Tax=Lindgomyces ingoldianus TaxID=673940 RepID=A0ACB6QW81_9PLEO|nr:uncharacterized protein BDR25DRAFT_342528 [Lindgomyces ingoldianus]KAF2471196.1 hypothetical protein BDR25DRAFT_342528 [Lindgomyces ingoldianus]